ncbi:Tfiif-interacting ctd phosphatase [Globisporangium polare]
MDEHLRRKDVVCAAALLLEHEALTWSVTDGAEVDAGQVVGSAGLIERGNLHQLLAPCRGKLRIQKLDQVKDADAAAVNTATATSAATNGTGGDASVVAADKDAGGSKQAESNGDVVVAFVEYCTHPLKSGRTCMMCLEVVDENEEDMDGERRSVNVVSHGQVLRLNIEEAKKFDSDNIKRQLGAKKLSLVLDLDHTLLHAVRVTDVVGEIPKTEDTFYFYIPGMNGQQHVVKFRPGLDTFLRELSALYDLFIYTHGTRLYAEQIASIIDPKGTFFQHRIVARTDTPDMVHKSLKLLFPSSDDSMILVLDDRIDVWKENEGNVFLIEPYHYFKCTAEINNAAGKGVGGSDDSGTGDDDNHLNHARSVLKQVHSAFYNDHHGVTVEEQMGGNGRDVKEILGTQKRSVLTGCNIVFSGVFPIGGHRGPESHHLWRLAVDLGARPSMVMNDFPITHLVIHPGRLGTQKHVQAKATPNVFVVTPEWIFKCARTWSRAPEKDFLADEWKAKQEKLVREAEKAAENVTEAPAAAAAPVDPVNLDPVSDAPAVPVESLASEETKQVVEAQAEATPPTASNGAKPDESAPPASATKKRKAVSFAADIPGGEEETKEGGKSSIGAASTIFPSSSSSKQRRVPVRRVIGGARVGGVRIPEHKGVVASGGTFDFLSKITQIGASKREQKPTTESASKPAANIKPAQPAPVKDVDDAFLRLIEAEERENAVETKRKLESDNLKDMLSARRLKKAKAAAAVSSTIQTPSEDDDDDDGDNDLDDLEADILGDF